MKDKTIIAVAAIFVIGCLEVVALIQGINGMVLTAAVAAIAGLGGYEIRNVSDLFERKGKPPLSLPTSLGE